MRFEAVGGDELPVYDNWLKGTENGHILQSSKWAEFKRGEWEPYLFLIKEGSDILGSVSVLVRKMPFSSKKILYSSRGPVFLDYDDAEVWKCFTAGIMKFAREVNGAFLKIDPAVSEESKCKEYLRQLGYKSLKTDQGFGGGIQPAATIRVDLSRPLDEILASFPKKTRYGIRRAETNGVIFKRMGLEGLEDYYEAMKATAKRAKLSLRSLNYYRGVMEQFGEDSTLINSYYNDQLVSSGLYVKFGSKVWALYGGITYKHSHLQVGHALEWEAMKWAKEKSAAWFDFFGIPVSREAESAKNRGVYGIYRFKRTFGGQEIDFIGENDLPVDRLGYSAWQLLDLGRKGVLALKKKFS